MRSFPHYRQLDAMDCGPTCLRMIARYYGKEYSLATLRQLCHITRNGVSMLGISEAAAAIGFRTKAVKIDIGTLADEVPMPCILHWNQRHFVVCHRVTRGRRGRRFHISDPATKKLVYSEQEMLRCWGSTGEGADRRGAVLALAPGPDMESRNDPADAGRRSLGFFLRSLKPYRRELFLLAAGMLLASVLQLIFPFLTQSLVDIGIHGRNIRFIVLILIAQLVLTASQTAVDFARSWIMLHVTARINISLISDFLCKLMKLPLDFFDTRNVGDILQRIGDHGRIEQFLMGSSLSTLFSMVNFLVFAVVLAIYSPLVLTIFLAGNSCYILWVTAFMKRRRDLDIRRFEQAAAEQSSLVQMVTAMQEIKLNNCERQKRWQWERIQVKLFGISLKGQALGQVQQVGSVFFNQATGIVISYIAARGVVDGTMTLGMMVSLTYIVGALNGPVNSFIGFIRQWQDAKISLERLNEIHCRTDEERDIDSKSDVPGPEADIRLEGVGFAYDGTERSRVLHDVSLTVAAGKTTAIVGASGSGKTTLLKLLLGFYRPCCGRITVGGRDLTDINPHGWRDATGAVMQEGFIFSDTIAGNIAVGDDRPDPGRLRDAAATACIDSFVDSLPLGFDTRIGMEGCGVSQGQKQRILIARTVYKNPRYIFLDEATNALDANNERDIMANLGGFCRGKTVVIVAHRLSTVRNADNIVVLDHGRIAEQGTHSSLTAQRGLYYNLIKNQLELGN